MRYELATIAVIAVALTTTAAIGQESAPIVTTSAPATFPFSPPEAAHGWSSTALEGYLRGSAVLTRAQGEKNLMDSQALGFIEDARSKYFDNRVKFTETQFQIKELKYNYRELQRQRALAKRLKGKQLKPQVDQEVAKSYQLSEFQFNPVTGAIYWPQDVASPRYAAYRHRIAMLMDQMVKYGVAHDEFYRNELARACDQFMDQLRADASDQERLRDANYQEAIRFLVGLKYTPHLLSPNTGELVAMNH